MPPEPRTRRSPGVGDPGSDKITAAKQDHGHDTRRVGQSWPERHPDWLRSKWTPAFVEGRDRVLGDRDGLKRAGRRIAELVLVGRLTFEHLPAVVEAVAATRPRAQHEAEQIVLRHVSRELSRRRSREAA